MPSPQHEQIVAMIRSRATPADNSIEAQRAGMEEMLSMFPLAEDVAVDEFQLEHLNADWVQVPESDFTRVVLYLHGGGYVLGSNRTHRELASRIARAAQARVLLPNYRLAPEHPFPAAVEDAVMAYQWLLAHGTDAQHISLAGDSAGGGLTLATLLALKSQGLPLPACAVCLSPWTDLEGTGGSAQPGGADDPMIELEGLRDMGRLYAGEDLRNPLAAPLYGDYAGLPPLLIQVGTRELLLDDSTRVAEKAEQVGVEVSLEIEPGLIHVWQALGPDVPESITAVNSIGEFIRRNTPHTA